MKNNTRKNTTHSRGFTLIELLVVIAIIVILSTIAMIALQNARAKGRDTRRVADVDQMQTALALYYRDKGQYPATNDFVVGASLTATTSAGTVIYMATIPTAPTPADGTCSNSDNTYRYVSMANGKRYAIYYCLGGLVGDVGSGQRAASSNGIAAEKTWQAFATYDGYTSGATVINGVPYIAYSLGPQDGFHGFVKKYVNGNWENVGIGGNGISDSSAVVPVLKTSENGDLYAFYITFNGEHVAVSKYTGAGDTGWEQLGDQSFFPSSNTSFRESWAIKNNNIYVVYNYNNGTIKVGKYDGSTWTQLGGNITDEHGAYLDIIDIAVSDNNEVYVLYHNFANKGVYVEKFNSDTSSWDQVGIQADYVDGYANDAIKIFNGQICVFRPTSAYSNFTIQTECFNGSDWSALGFYPNHSGLSGFGLAYNPAYLAAEYTDGTAYLAYNDADQGGKVTVLQNSLKPADNLSASEWFNAGYPGLSDGAMSDVSLFTDNSGKLYLYYMDGGKTYIKKYSR